MEKENNSNAPNHGDNSNKTKEKLQNNDNWGGEDKLEDLSQGI